MKEYYAELNWEHLPEDYRKMNNSDMGGAE